MGGIIAGFLGGSANGMAEAGKMLLADNLAKERDEADFLRRSELRKSENLADREFRSKERQAGQEFSTTERVASDETLIGREEVKSGRTKAAAALKAERDSAESKLNRESSEKISADRLKAAAKDNRTTQMKNMDRLMSEKGGSKSLEEAIILTFENATIKHTDEEGNISVAVMGEDGFEDLLSFRTNDQGRAEVVKPGKDPIQTKVTKKDRQGVADEWNERDNKTLFKWNANDDEVKAETEKRFKEGTIGNAPKPAGGLVGKQVDAAKDKDTKNIQGRKMSKTEYVSEMIKKHGEGKRAAIEAQWTEYQ